MVAPNMLTDSVEFGLTAVGGMCFSVWMMRVKIGVGIFRLSGAASASRDAAHKAHQLAFEQRCERKIHQRG